MRKVKEVPQYEEIEFLPLEVEVEIVGGKFEKSLEEIRAEDYMFGRIHSTFKKRYDISVGTDNDFRPIDDPDSTSSYRAPKVQCISMMTKYKEKSLEELRIEDYTAENFNLAVRKLVSDTTTVKYKSGRTGNDTITSITESSPAYQDYTFEELRFLDYLNTLEKIRL